jgi:hypothetical protein
VATTHCARLNPSTRSRSWSVSTHQVSEDRSVFSETEYTLDLIEIYNDGAPFAFRIAGTLLFMGEGKDAIPLFRVVRNPCASDELQQGRRRGCRIISSLPANA